MVSEIAVEGINEDEEEERSTLTMINILKRKEEGKEKKKVWNRGEISHLDI